MKNNDDIFNEFENKYNSNDFKLPQSLSKDSIQKLISEKNIRQEVKLEKIYPKVLSYAAIFILVIVTGLIVNNVLSDSNKIVAVSPSGAETTVQADISDVQETTKQNNLQSQTASQIETTNENQEIPPSGTDETTAVTYPVLDSGLETKSLSKAKSDKALKKYFENIYSDENYNNNNNYGGSVTIGGIGSNGIANAPVTTAPGAPNKYYNDNKTYSRPINSAVTDENQENSADLYGETNTQVEGVDEADIIKNDGRYLYIVTYSNYLTIVDTETMEKVWYGEIHNNDAEAENNLKINDIYVNGNYLVAICTLDLTYSSKADESSEVTNGSDEETTVAEFSDSIYWYYDSDTVTVTFDISDKTAPREIRRVSQDGSLVSSRMVDNYLYTVSLYNVSGNGSDLEYKYMPSVNDAHIGSDCVYIRESDEDNTSYVLMTAYDISDVQSEIGKVSVLGSASNIYCTPEALYVSATQYKYDDETNYGNDYTDIYAFSIDKNNISYVACGSVNGSSINQFCLDEYENCLRIATTSQKNDPNGGSINESNIYILNKNLELIGKLEDIAEDEQIESARFMGTICYLVTFRNTDPLFTIDLSDPTNPNILGEVKLPGFSSYLHPVGENLVIGIGYAGNKNNADFSSLKISLFDVSDLKNPKEIDCINYSDDSKEYYSDIMFDAKSFIFDKESNTFGIPIYSIDYDSNGMEYFYDTFTVKDGKLVEQGKFSNSTEDYFQLFRGTYIGENIYTINENEVSGFNSKTGEIIGKIDISQNYVPVYSYIDCIDYAK